jgi:hypothetical protein
MNKFSYQNINHYTIFREKKELEKQITKENLGFLNFVLSDESYFALTEGFNQSLRTLFNLIFKSLEGLKFSSCLELIKDTKEIIATDEVDYDPVLKIQLCELEKIFYNKIEAKSKENFTKKLL